MPEPSIAAFGHTERERHVVKAIHSGKAEGLHVSPAGLADANDYVAGQIDSAELVTHSRARHGLT